MIIKPNNLTIILQFSILCNVFKSFRSTFSCYTYICTIHTKLIKWFRKVFVTMYLFVVHIINMERM